MKKKNIFIIIFVIIFIIFFIYLFINSRKDIEVEEKNKEIEEKEIEEANKLQEVVSYKKDDNKIVFTLKPYKSYSYNEWNYFIDGSQMLDIQTKLDYNCSGKKRLDGDCDGDTVYTIKALSSGNATIWFTTSNDVMDANKTNTICYDLEIDENLNIEVTKIDFVSIGY